ncbi:MAG TPA: hypothetical protein ENH24_03250, partial [Nitrospirae bacterium]|nr:hypothetical protein [Nitrospirota bacterium]
MANIIANNKHYFHCCLYLFLSIVTMALYFPSLSSFWLFDDLYILRYASENSPLNFFFNPVVWRMISFSHLTPWITASFFMDYRLFGFHYEFFYLHQLISLALASILLYIALRYFIRWQFALLGSLMFLASAPAAAASQLLMIRHYLEGLSFTILSFLFAIGALRKENIFYSLLSALFYFLAMSAKEIYVPIGLVAFLLPVGHLRKRFLYLMPLLLTFFGYIYWRDFMLGQFVAGVSDVQNVLKSYGGGWGSILLFLKNVYGSFVMFAGVNSNAVIINMIIMSGIILVSLLAFLSMVRSRRYADLLFLSGLTMAVYSIPFIASNLFYAVNDFFMYRLVILISAYLSLLTALSLNRIYQQIVEMKNDRLRLFSKYTLTAFSVGFLLLFTLNSMNWIRHQRTTIIDPLITEGRFFMKAG